MFKNTSLRALISLLILLMAAGSASSTGLDGKELSEQEVKNRVESFGLGVTARVKVRLRNGSDMEGFIERAGEDHFYLIRTDEGVGTAAVIAYRDVIRIEGKTAMMWRRVVDRMGTGAGLVLGALRRLRTLVPGYRPEASPVINFQTAPRPSA
jgi:hypothetical protein